MLGLGLCCAVLGLCWAVLGVDAVACSRCRPDLHTRCLRPGPHRLLGALNACDVITETVT
eukprot:2808738-Rhodomonas_salina.1